MTTAPLIAWKPFCRAATGILMALLSAAPRADAAEPDRNVDGIRDNSFLVEEAYNQEAGVVQHILTGAYAYQQAGGSDMDSWNFGFTQEWPLFGQRHQLGYTNHD